MSCMRHMWKKKPAVSRSKDFDGSCENNRENALKYAFKLLGYRDRSEKELSEKLTLKGFSEKAAGEAVAYLKERKFIDDERLAERLKTDAVERRHLGARGVRSYLIKRGIPREIIDRLSGEEADYADSAKELVEKKLRYMKASDPETVKRRLWGLLARKGFSYDTINKVMKNLNIKEEQE